MWQAHGPKLALAVAVGAAFLLSPILSSVDAYFFQIILFVGINIILASSLNLINGFTGQFSLGHAGFMSVGAYASAWLTAQLALTGESAFGSTLLLTSGMLAGGLAAAIVGLAVGIPSLRLKGDYLAIVTLGAGEIIRVIIQNIDALGGARGFTGIPKLTTFGWTFAIVALVLFVIGSLVTSSYGKGFVAVRDDELAAEAMGLSTTRYKVTAFVTGAFFAGVAGVLYAHFVTYVNPSQFSFLRSIEIVVMVIVGGMGSITGVVLAAILLTILPEALRGIAEYRMVIYSLLLIVIMILRPQGLFGNLGVWVRRMWRMKRSTAHG